MRDTTPTLAANLGGQSLCTDITELLRPGPADVAWLRTAARHAAHNHDAVAAWLDGLCQNDSTVRDLAARSYWHPNGFAKLVLHVSREPEFRIRLHVWPVVPAGPLLGESNPHSHRWEFASTVITGDGLHMAEYRETERGGKPYDRYRYGGDAGDPAALLPDGVVRLTRIESPYVHRGQIYSCDTTVVHTVVPIGVGLTATLVIQGPHRSSSTVVYCTPGRSEDQPNGELSESDFIWLVKSVAAAINREGRSRT
jgi:hypothetical protein